MTYVNVLIHNTEATEKELQSVCNYLEAERGVHSVTVERNHNNDAFAWLSVVGTDLACRRAKRLIGFSVIKAKDNADHDHDACIAAAQKMGVPAAWAHTPETYLSM